MKHIKQNKLYFDADCLTEGGLNIHFLINISDLPDKFVKTIYAESDNRAQYSQLLLVGHRGKNLWTNVVDQVGQCENPVDDHSIKVIEDCLVKKYNELEYQLIYPNETLIDLQQLGELAGWHYPSPFKVGINEEWGSWFAYRAVVLLNSNFETTAVFESKSPCESCITKICISSCPAKALMNNEFNFKSCIDYRKQADSKCKDTCCARVSCPIGEEYKYSDEQVKYHYSVSMKTINELY